MIRHGFYVLFGFHLIWFNLIWSVLLFIINNIAFGFLHLNRICMRTFLAFYTCCIRRAEKKRKKNTLSLNGWRTRHAQTIMSVDQCPRRRRNLLVFGTCRMVNDIRRLRSIVPPSWFFSSSSAHWPKFASCVVMVSCVCSAIECKYFVYMSCFSISRLRGSISNWHTNFRFSGTLEALASEVAESVLASASVSLICVSFSWNRRIVCDPHEIVQITG